MARKALLATLAVVVVLPVTAASPGEPGHLGNRPNCARKGSKTIYASPRVRVYAVPRDYGEQRYACLRYLNRRWGLGEVYEDDASYLSNFQERGPWLGFVNDWGTKGGGEGMNAVTVNLRTGKATGSPHLFTVIHAYGLTRRGSLAWTESADPEYGNSDPTVTSVYARAVGAKERLLDSGADIERASLAVGGKHVYWVKAGHVQSAILP